MFKLALLTVSIIALTYARPQAPAATAVAPGGVVPAKNVTFIKNDRTPLDDKSSYNYNIELSDGTKLIQEGHTEPPTAGSNESSLVVKGSYSYIDPKGIPVTVMYIANKDGYQPTGSVIPVDTNSKSAKPATAAPVRPSA